MNREQILDIVCDQVARDIDQVSVLFNEYSCDNLPKMCHTIADRIHAALEAENK